jgi:hypothetical protein
MLRDWESPVGVARIVLGLSAIWLIFTALTGLTASKAVLPLTLMMLALGFVGGYQTGHNKR